MDIDGIPARGRAELGALHFAGAKRQTRSTLARFVARDVLGRHFTPTGHPEQPTRFPPVS